MPSSLDQLVEIENVIERLGAEWKLTEDDRDNLAIAITELTNNAIIHGNKLDHNKNVVVSFYLDDSKIRVYVKDNGNGFNPDNVANPLDPENLLKETGRGIFILRSMVDDVQFFFSEKGTEVKIVKNCLIN